MAVLFIPIWKEAPFLRIVLPFIAGIIIAHYLPVPGICISAAIILSLAVIGVFSFTRLALQFRFAYMYGICINLLLVSTGALVTEINNDAAREPLAPPFILTVTQPLSEKPKTWKAITSSPVIIYFSKDSMLVKPQYGDIIAFTKMPEDNKVFLRPEEFIILAEKDINPFKVFLFRLQSWVVHTLQLYIGGKKECGLAEALLIGYKDNLDRDLMKSYSNTGVVHVVAISGLHLGLIYMLLKYLCYPVVKRKHGKWLSPLIIISGLWIFSLLAGGSPSVMRSAVMFTFIVAGESFKKKTSIYNNLAASAFFLLCYDPGWLWDIGFQLSYSALLSIVIFMKPVYNQLVFKNKLFDYTWKLNAVTLAAQILTTPVCVFYFHQFPNLFVFTNFIAVPLSSIILLGEIALCILSPFEPVAEWLGHALTLAIRLMNSAVEWLGSFPFSTTNDLQLNLFQAVMIYLVIGLVVMWTYGFRRHN